MRTITAVIRARNGEERPRRDALLNVADNVRVNEPGTVGFFISQDLQDPCVFTPCERFTEAAMDRHNGSHTVASFFAIARPLLDAAVTLVTGAEISVKG